MIKITDMMKAGLLEFTGLSELELEDRVQRKKLPFQDEWRIFDPKSPTEISWYYCVSSAYLFGNASHEMPKEIMEDIPKGSTVLDFGGGCGTVSLCLAQRGCSVLYFDVSLIQTEFVSFMARKHNLDISIARGVNPREMEINRSLDCAVALDVLEHIPDYPKYLTQISNSLKQGGKIYYYAPFGHSEPAHMEDKFGLDKVAADCGLTRSHNRGIVSCMIKTGHS